MRNIFIKRKLRPAQLRTVADRRFDDAQVLRRTGKAKHANGAMYLGGFVLECLLKAMLMEHYRWLQSARTPEGRTQDEKSIWSLCYRSHDLDEILGRIPEARRRLEDLEQRTSQRLIQHLQSVCAQWTVYARYSPEMATIQDADDFLDKVEELRKWLR